MDWHAEIKQVIVWWAGWKVLDVAWEYLLGGTVLSFVALAYARYRNSPLQRELRGAAIGFTVVTLAIMASLLATRPSVPLGNTGPSGQNAWPILSSEKAAHLSMALKSADIESLQVTCNQDGCGLAESICDAAKTAGAKSRVLSGTIEGVASGLMLLASGQSRVTSDKVAKAIQEATNFPVIVHFTHSTSVSNFLVVGTKPRLADVVVGEGPNPPSTGSFREGDIWRNSNPQAGGTFGWIWVCDQSNKCSWNPYGSISL